MARLLQTIFGFLASGLALFVPGSLPAASPDLQIREAEAWLDKIDIPDVKERPLVRVFTGSYSGSGNGRDWKSLPKYGFLFRDEAGQFTVFFEELPMANDQALGEIEDSPLRTGPTYSRVDYEVLDLKKEAAAILALLDERAAGKIPHESRWGLHLSTRTDIFIFAHACRQNGLEELADALAAKAARLPDPFGDGRHRSLRESLETEIGQLRMLQLTHEFTDLKISRAELLAHFEEFVRLYPGSNEVPRAQKICEILREMIAEEETHRPKPLEMMTPEEQSAEWIFRLRDQTGQNFTPGSVDLFADLPTRPKNTPAHQLAALGTSAVPALIETLGDQRFCRCIKFRSVLRIGDCARAILDRISGRDLFSSRVDYRAPAREGEIAVARRAAQEWWDELQAKGEKETWIEGTKRGDQDSLEQARKLMNQFPDSALEPIIAGARASNLGFIRAQLIELAARTRKPEAIAFLHDEMKDGLSTGTRLTAAEWLFRLGSNEAVPTMIDEWNRVRKSLSPKFPDSDHADDLIEFLGKCGDPAALAALRQHFAEEAVDVRLAIIRALGQPTRNSSVSATGKVFAGRAEVQRSSPSADDEAAEEFLIAALSDPEVRTGMSFGYGEIRASDPRICEMAALMLSLRWPDKYAFRWSEEPAQRDAQIRSILNAWHKAHG